MKFLFLIISLLFCFSVTARDKYAVTVFISEYPSESGWNQLNSSNDKSKIIPKLIKIGYKEENIICLEDKYAIFSNIINAFQILFSKVDQGDEVYIHFSCHGQQITDINQDEASVNYKDKYDEAIVPYDAFISYNWNGYKGDKHLTDDLINYWLNRIATKVGKEGIVIFVADACHSGDIIRDKANIKSFAHRGTFDRFELPLSKIKENVGTVEVNWISISACKEFQTNYECEVNGIKYGRLSYAISNSIARGVTISELTSEIRNEYLKLKLPYGKAQTLEVSCPDRLKKQVIFQ